MPISPAALRTLREMDELEGDPSGDGELVCEGNVCYIGVRRVARKTANELLRYAAIRSDLSSDGVDRFVINETGKAVVKRPDLADEVLAAVLRDRRPFTIVNGHIKFED